MLNKILLNLAEFLSIAKIENMMYNKNITYVKFLLCIMRYSFVLDKIFGQKPKIRALRYLSSHKPEASIREISREIKISPPNASIALKELEKEGVLKSARVGRSMVYSLNLGHYLVEKIVRPVFDKEREIKNELINQIKKNINFPYESIILFGSVRRGDEKSISDIDLAFIVGDNEAKAKIEENIAGLNPIIAKEFGNTLSPVIISQSDFIKKMKNNDGLIREIINNGEVVAGKLINQLL